MIRGMQPSAEKALPEPPWWEVPKRGEPRATLSREAIVDAAMDVLDNNGLDGLSMRRVAETLGTGPASLYWHVADKEQLIHLILDRVMGEIELPEPDQSRWEEQIREFAQGRGPRSESTAMWASPRWAGFRWGPT